MSGEAPAIVKMLEMLMKAPTIDKYCSMLKDIADLDPSAATQASLAKRVRDFRATAVMAMKRFHVTEAEAVQMLTEYLYGPQVHRPVDASTQLNPPPDAGTP